MIARSCLRPRTTPIFLLLANEHQPSPQILRPRISLSRSPFTTSPPHRKDEAGFPNHYETLGLPTNASPGEIKKKFYALSKSAHPDLHPNNPRAHDRFLEISEAYATLGSSERRARYDRDLHRSIPSSTHSGRGHSFTSSSSSSSFGSAGGRSPSGLSRRRTKFQGPPPSFYRSGGYGAYGAKREDSASRPSHQARSAGGGEGEGAAQSATASAAPGTGPGGFAQGLENDVPHFDHRGHYQTHSEIERTRHRARRRQRVLREEEEEGRGAERSVGASFVLVGGILVVVGITSRVVMGREEPMGAAGRRVRQEDG